jgi:polyhydroxyalkanoate synthesis regulator phasin
MPCGKRSNITMAGLGDMVQKAFYLGLGIAAYAGEKAGVTLGELRSQVQKLADEMVARGEITAEEAKRLVDEMVSRAQQAPPPNPSNPGHAEPIRIEILDDDAPDSTSASETEELRSQVEKLRNELNNLRQS